MINKLINSVVSAAKQAPQTFVVIAVMVAIVKLVAMAAESVRPGTGEQLKDLVRI